MFLCFHAYFLIINKIFGPEWLIFNSCMEELNSLLKLYLSGIMLKQGHKAPLA